MNISHRAFYVWRRNFNVYLAHVGASIVGNIGEPLLYLFCMGLGIGGYIQQMGGVSYMQYIAPGLIVTSAMYSATIECTFGAFTRLSSQRTYESILATPVSLEDLAFGEALWGATKSCISGVTMLIVMTAFGLYTPGPGFFGIMAVVWLTGMVFAAAALSFSAISPSYEFFNYYFTMAIAPMFFLSGVFFPLDNFPAPFQLFSQALPATHAAVIIRNLFYGAPAPHAWVSVLALMALAVALVRIATFLIRRRLIV
ncbi:MAG: ABC transporter permease [Nitrospinota bacterium]|nr:ABC transporter permease [Nitrospinota bacterium]